MQASIREIEQAIAEEALAHADAVASLNPYSEAEWLAIGNSKLVYAGANSSVFGVYQFGIDEIWEEREWMELERFFSRKDRPPHFWVNPLTPENCLERIRESHRPTRKQLVYGANKETISPENLSSLQDPADLELWGKHFSRKENPEATEAGYLALVKLHQKNTRFYENKGEASYTFFHGGIALVPYPSAGLSLFQRSDARKFHCKIYCEFGASDLPLIYERILYEPI